MLDLIEIELARIRKIAEHFGEISIMYFIDLAILEAKHAAQSRKDSVEETDLLSGNRAKSPE